MGLLINNNLISGCSKYKPCNLNIAQSAKCSYEKKRQFRPPSIITDGKLISVLVKSLLGLNKVLIYFCYILFYLIKLP